MEFRCAVLLLSFGGPEGPEQVRPFLENVTRGRGVPPERLDDVAKHYLHFGGVSPINGINRALIGQLEAELADAGLDLPVYFGNRNWEPYVEDTVAAMRDNGVRRAAVFTTSAWGGYSSCTQYVEDIARGRKAAGERAPELVKLRQYFDHPLLVEMFAEAIADAAQKPARRAARLTPGWCSPRTPFRLRPAPVAAPTFTPARSRTRRGSSQPMSGYDDFDQVWQSRSGPPQVPWLEPDVADHLSSLADAGTKAVIVCPIGFVADHIEVVWDLDNELRAAGRRVRHGVRQGPHPQCRPSFRPAGGRPDRRTTPGPRAGSPYQGRMPLRCMAFRSTARSARLTAATS